MAVTLANFMRLVVREMMPYCTANTQSEAIMGVAQNVPSEQPQVSESVVKLKYRPTERYCGAACPATAVNYPSLTIDCECMVVPSAVFYFDGRRVFRMVTKQNKRN